MMLRYLNRDDTLEDQAAKTYNQQIKNCISQVMELVELNKSLCMELAKLSTEATDWPCPSNNLD